MSDRDATRYEANWCPHKLMTAARTCEDPVIKVAPLKAPILRFVVATQSENTSAFARLPFRRIILSNTVGDTDAYKSEE